MTTPPTSTVTIKYRLDASAAIAAFEALAQQCARAAEVLRQIEAKYPPTCARNIARSGQPPEHCGEPVADNSEYCPAHRFVDDGDNSDEPVGFDD